MMRIVFIILGVLAVLVIAVLAAPFLVPRDWLVAKVENIVRDATGRPFAINGDVSLSFIPTPRVVAEKVRFGEGDEPLLTIGKLETVVALWPLLSGTIDVQRFVVDSPVANLRVDKNGNANWQQQPVKNQPTSSGGGSGGGKMGLPEVDLGEIRVDDGVVDYQNAQANFSERVDAIDLEVKGKDLAGQAAIVGSAKVRGEKVGLDVQVQKVRDLLNSMSSPGSASIKGLVNASLDGTLSATPSGRVRIEVPDVAKALNWLKFAAPSGVTLPKQASLTGDLNVKGQIVTFQNADLSSNVADVKGNLKFDRSGQRPGLTGDLSTGVVDLTKLLPPPAEGAAQTAGTAQQPKDDGSAASQPAPADTPLNVPTSLPIDLDLKLQAQGVKSQRATLGPMKAHATAGAKHVLVDLQQAQAYNGTIAGRANAAADAQGTPRIAVKLTSKGVQLGPLLNDLADQDRLDGRASLNLDVTGDGRSVNRLLGGLDGKADVTILDATVKGFDLSAVSGNPVEIAAKLAQSGLKGGSTKFERASASFNIADGIATTDDISAKAPPVQITGSGRFNLGERRIEKMRLLPAATPGQGGDFGNLPVVPVTISGPFTSPSFSVDASAALRELAKDPKTINKAVDEAKKLGGGKDGKSLLPKDAGKLLEGLLGRGQ